MTTTKIVTFVFLLPLIMTAMALAQNQSHKESLSVQGYSGQATVIRSQGRVFVDVQDLAGITNGSLSFGQGRMVLTLPCDTPERATKALTNQAFLVHS